MPTRFINRSDAWRHAQKQKWSSFRTTLDPIDQVWKAHYEPGTSPAADWAKDKEFVAWTETAWDDAKNKLGVLIVTCTEAELVEEQIPDIFLVEPITPSLWEKDKPRKEPTVTPHGDRERSTVLNPTKLVWQTADEMPDADRKTVIARCVALGIHPATASTQYSKWRKKRLAT